MNKSLKKLLQVPSTARCNVQPLTREEELLELYRDTFHTSQNFNRFVSSCGSVESAIEVLRVDRATM